MQKMLVLRGLSTNILCGCDFLRDHKVVLDISKEVANFEGAIEVPLIRKREFLGV